VLARLRLLFVVLVLALMAGAAHATEVTIKKGDTLVRLAKRHGVSVADLRKWNRGRIGKGGVLKRGAKINVTDPALDEQVAVADAKPSAAKGPSWTDELTVRRGDSLGKIAQREGVALSDLMAWNKLNERSKLKPGQRLTLQRAGQRPKASSIGRPTAGSLRYGEPLTGGPGYRLRFPKHTYTLETVAKSIRQCVKRTKDAFPGTVDVLIGELSRAGGGHFSPHESHQSGRDADIGYYLAKNTQNETMHKVRPGEIDFAKTWSLLRCLITTDEVSRVYMDKTIQAAMADWLRTKKTMSEDDLQRLFAVLGGEGALIRHAAKHDTHFHVRFSCDAGQAECVEESDESPFKL